MIPQPGRPRNVPEGICRDAWPWGSCRGGEASCRRTVTDGEGPFSPRTGQRRAAGPGQGGGEAPSFRGRAAAPGQGPGKAGPRAPSGGTGVAGRPPPGTGDRKRSRRGGPLRESRWRCSPSCRPDRSFPQRPRSRRRPPPRRRGRPPGPRPEPWCRRRRDRSRRRPQGRSRPRWPPSAADRRTVPRSWGPHPGSSHQRAPCPRRGPWRSGRGPVPWP